MEDFEEFDNLQDQDEGESEKSETEQVFEALEGWFENCINQPLMNDCNSPSGILEYFENACGIVISEGHAFLLYTFHNDYQLMSKKGMDQIWIDIQLKTLIKYAPIKILRRANLIR